MKNLLILVCLFVNVASFSCKEAVAQNQVSDITALEANKVLKDKTVQLVDVRTPLEYSESHLENAKNIDFKASTFTSYINELDKNKPVLVYCRSGKRSAESVKVLVEAGFTKIYNLKEGILSWQAERLPLVTN